MDRSRLIRVRALPAAIAALLPLAATAQQAAGGGLETLIVTGTRLPESGPIAASTVLDRGAIERRNDPSVAELLTGVPGLYVESPGSRGTVGSVFVRGGEANFTQVFIDGVQVNDPTNSRGGSFDFTGLDVDEIARLEVVRGPLSSVYGSDALAGVIQIFTDEETEGAGASLDAGSADRWRASAHLARPFGDGSRYSFAASAEADTQDRSIGAYRGHALAGSIDLSPGAATELAIHLRHGESEARAFPDASGGALFAVLREQDRRDASDDTLGLTLTTQPRGDSGWQWHLDASLFDHGEQNASAGVVPGVLEGVPASQDDGDFRRDRLGLYASSPRALRWQGAFGLDYQRESGTSRGSLTFAPGAVASTSYDIERATTGGFAEIATEAGERLTLSAALREDDSAAAGERTTGKLAARYRLTAAGMGLRLSWGQGFKLPSLFSLAHPLVGNPALKPERATALELGLESATATKGFGWELNVFEQHFRDLIDFDFDSFMSVNRARVDVGGIEAAAHWTGDAWRIEAHATALDVQVLGSTEPLNQRPERLAGVSARWRLAPAVDAFLGWRYVGPRYDSSIPTGRERLAGFARTDLSLGWALSETLGLRLAIDNVFDREYQTAIGFPDPGRLLRVGLRYRAR